MSHGGCNEGAEARRTVSREIDVEKRQNTRHIRRKYILYNSKNVF